MAFNISNINGGCINLNKTIIDSNGGNLIVIANDPNAFDNNILRSDTHITYYYTGETITINNTGTYYLNDNSVYNTGPTGYTGYQGPIGYQGAVGAGVQGPQGVIGGNGVQGFQGSRGSDGIIGVNGLQGNQGIIGKGFVIFSHVNSFNDIGSVSASNTNIGEFVLVKGGDLYVYYGNNAGSTGPNNSYSYAGDITDESKLNGFQGNVGPQGSIGFQGAVGSGFQGFQGVVGSAGSNGVQGSIGFQGFQGVVGSTGSNGVQGFQGAVGSAGSNGVQGFQGAVGIISITGALNKYIDTTKTVNIISLTGAYGSWVSRINGNSTVGYGIDVDSLGNSYVTGLYRSPATIYNSDGTVFTTMSGSGPDEAFVAKFGSTGMGTWVSRISGTSSDIGNGIAVDSLGSSYVTGQYNSPATIYNSDGTAFRTMSGSGSTEAFVAKFGSTGMGTWVSRISGISLDEGRGIDVDSVGNSYVTGLYISPATIYNSDGTAFRTMSGSGNAEAFVAKFGSTGMGSWVSRISGSSLDQGRGITVDSVGNSYVTGNYRSPATIYNSDGTAFQTISGSLGDDIFVAKFGSTGMGSWVSRISGTSIDEGRGIAVDSLGNSYVAGVYRSPATIYNSDGTAFQTLTGNGNNEVFVAKFGSTGMGSWVSRISGTSVDEGRGIAVDSLGNSYVTGQYTSPAIIYNSDGTAFQTLTGNGGLEAFVVKFGSTGMGSWSSRISGIETDIGYGIAVDSLGNSYVTGQYNSSTTIYNSDGTAFRTMSVGSTEAFVVKLNDGPDSIASYYLVDLDNNPSNNGTTVYISNKVYQAGFILNLQTQSLVTYSTISVTTSISLIFYNGTWIVLSQS